MPNVIRSQTLAFVFQTVCRVRTALAVSWLVFCMTRTVFCRKHRQELEGLDAPPLPGPKGQEIFETVSVKAWTEWQSLQTMLINEKNLRLIDPDARRYLAEQMEKFLNNEPIDRIEGYVPPED